MNTSALTPLLPQVTPVNNQIGVDGNPAKNLQLGQILYGKVLRAYQDGSYLVDLNGQQHVVDSAIPLKQDEVFRGKIIGLEEHVVLEKMVTVEGAVIPADELASPLDAFTKNLASDIKAFIDQHYSIFSTSDWKALIRVANQAKQPQLILASAVYLQKIGIPFNTELTAKLADYLSKDKQLKSLLSHDVLHLSFDALTAQSQLKNDAMALLADHLKQKTEESLDHARDLLHSSKLQGLVSDQSRQTNGGDSDGSSENQFNQAAFQWLMNIQTGSSISHRLVVLPLVLDGNLVELEMALFNQNENTNLESDLKHKVIHLSLTMPSLGKINVAVNAVNQNLRVHFSSESETGLHMLAAHNQYLTKELQNLGYKLDELTYTVERTEVGAHHIARPIVDLVVNTDSLSMLV